MEQKRAVFREFRFRFTKTFTKTAAGVKKRESAIT